jgi:hypothetical protein
VGAAVAFVEWTCRGGSSATAEAPIAVSRAAVTR